MGNCLAAVHCHAAYKGHLLSAARRAVQAHTADTCHAVCLAIPAAALGYAATLSDRVWPRCDVSFAERACQLVQATPGLLQTAPALLQTAQECLAAHEAQMPSGYKDAVAELSECWNLYVGDNDGDVAKCMSVILRHCSSLGAPGDALDMQEDRGQQVALHSSITGGQPEAGVQYPAAAAGSVVAACWVALIKARSWYLNGLTRCMERELLGVYQQANTREDAYVHAGKGAWPSVFGSSWW